MHKQFTIFSTALTTYKSNIGIKSKNKIYRNIKKYELLLFGLSVQFFGRFERGAQVGR